MSTRSIDRLLRRLEDKLGRKGLYRELRRIEERLDAITSSKIGRGPPFTRLVSKAPLDSHESGAMRAVRATRPTVQDVQDVSARAPDGARLETLAAVRRADPAVDRASGHQALQLDHRGGQEIRSSVQLHRRDRLRGPQAGPPEQGHAR